MKTLFTSTNTLRKFIACFSLVTALLITSAASAQTVQFTDQAPLHRQLTDGLKVAVFPVAHSLLMKVNFENPDKEKITILIKNKQGEVVYHKHVGRTALYNGKFDVSQIGDGNYTLIIESKKQSYANTFIIETHQERLARAL
jgi:hypothetical protein